MQKGACYARHPYNHPCPPGKPAASSSDIPAPAGVFPTCGGKTMNLPQKKDDPAYRTAMGRLLMLYTQVDRLIMEACAARIASAPDEAAKLGLAKQVGDESKHVTIQHAWMEKFGVQQAKIISSVQEAAILKHFRQLDWLDFLIDMYLCVEALGSDAVEKVVPLADPGTRESLRIPLQDELDHIAFGVTRLQQELAGMQPADREAFLKGIPERIERLNQAFHDMGLNVRSLFEAVGANYAELCRQVLERKDEILEEVAKPLAA